MDRVLPATGTAKSWALLPFLRLSSPFVPLAWYYTWYLLQCLLALSFSLLRTSPSIHWTTQAFQIYIRKAKLFLYCWTFHPSSPFASLYLFHLLIIRYSWQAEGQRSFQAPFQPPRSPLSCWILLESHGPSSYVTDVEGLLFFSMRQQVSEHAWWEKQRPQSKKRRR